MKSEVTTLEMRKFVSWHSLNYFFLIAGLSSSKKIMFPWQLTLLHPRPHDFNMLVIFSLKNIK